MEKNQMEIIQLNNDEGDDDRKWSDFKEKYEFTQKWFLKSIDCGSAVNWLRRESQRDESFID